MAAIKTFSLGVLFIVMVMFFASCAAGRRGGTEHQIRQLRPTRGFKEMELAAARNFGKRAVNMHLVNSILMEWLALENKMKSLRQQGNLPLPLETRDGAEMTNLADENAPGVGELMDE